MGLIFGIVFGLRRACRGGRLGNGRRGAEALEFVEGSIEGALDAGFVAGEGFDGAGAGGVVGEGAGAGVEGRGIFVAGKLGHAHGKQAGF